MTETPFAAFFAGPFQHAMERVEIPDFVTASWDRKAAYLLWLATDKGQKPLPIAAPEPPSETDIFA